METSSIIGFVAGLLSTFSFLPQVVKAFKTKHTKDLSLATFAILSGGVALWLVYGILIRELPVIIANISMLVLSVSILIMKIKYG